MAESLYIHIPFCLRKCPYCDFFSIPYERGMEREMERRYVNALKSELILRKDNIATLRTIYIGGGTPSVFEAGSIALLLEFINNNFGIETGAEITMEINPSSADDEKLRAIRQAGVNRISMGVQSLNDAELISLGRIHNAAEAVRALDIVNKYFGNFSVDLIYGLEGQTVGGWMRTVRRALSFAPPHVSAYELTPEADTAFGRRVMSGEAVLPEEDAIAAMYCSAAEQFGGAGLCHYEISNFARAGFLCRHNENYWRRGLYAGIGAGAHSHLRIPDSGQGYSLRSSNAADLMQYLTNIEHNTLPVGEMTIIDDCEGLKEDIFLGLRTAEGVSVERLRDGCIDVAGLQGLVENGLAELDETRLILTRRGFLVSNRIISSIMDKIDAQRGHSPKSV
ncbi:MAG: radical SAM family heme chaperone HemW [Nitrospirae bacterium]|nr:radical SAM family heme chaperone HemW [Nitrospirota bacterium]